MHAADSLPPGRPEAPPSPDPAPPAADAVPEAAPVPVSPAAAADQPAPPRRRLAWLDALRGVAALAVVYDHASYQFLVPVRDVITAWIDPGEFGVFVFFLISGYIVPASLERRGSVRGFWVSRLFRLYPAYILA